MKMEELIQYSSGKRFFQSKPKPEEIHFTTRQGEKLEARRALSHRKRNPQIHPSTAESFPPAGEELTDDREEASRTSSGEGQEEQPVPTSDGPAGELKQELEREREKSSDYLRRLQYLQADFENYRKRVEREMSDVKRYGNDRLLAELLVVMDELELGVQRAREQGESPALVEGMGMVLKRFQNLLAKEGVQRIEGAGSKFDPSKHEAALRVPSDKEEGVIVEEIRSGYTLKGRILRPSIVKVSQGKERPENVPNNTENIVEEE